MKLEKHKVIWAFRKTIVDLARGRWWSCLAMGKELGCDPKKVRFHVTGMEAEGWLRKTNIAHHKSNEPAYLFETIWEDDYTLDAYLDFNGRREGVGTIPVAAPRPMMTVDGLSPELLLLLGYTTLKPEKAPEDRRFMLSSHREKPSQLRKVTYGIAGDSLSYL